LSDRSKKIGARGHIRVARGFDEFHWTPNNLRNSWNRKKEA
jgi:hypothetical protein